ncbi:LuxR C-terminal-related transcriptional regulator [Lutimonas saemankumensis]|uniref:LuxR C-terminal-related transcriptional regulator n=1 Tax=Lutimonas saemankumensis TaxID=483016 RepID=UPI00293D1E9D|nr:LuxR C-terminal-related transcriptional regulator [Lutimonas saemankumensis]
MFSNEKLIPAKFQAPQLPTDLVVRTAIIDKLKKNTDTPIYLFSAPSGYGKTTAVIDWLHRFELPYCWLSLDEENDDLNKFVHYMITAIQRVIPEFGKEIDDITTSSQEISSRDYYIMISNALDALTHDVYLVLDDYHFIRTKEIHDLLNKLFRFSQQHLKLVITSRKDPPFPLSTWRMKNKLTEIRIRELKFNSREIDQFFQNQDHEEPLKDAIKTIEKITEGWVTALRLLSISGIHKGHDQKLLSASSMKSDKVLLELVHGMLIKQDPQVRERILRMSVAAEFDRELYQLITSQEDERSGSGLEFDEFIDILLNSNLFLIQLGEGHDKFRFHHLFHDLLLQNFLKEVPQQEIRSIYGKVALWYEENDQVEKCVEILLKLDQKSEALHIFTKRRAKIFEHSEWQLLEKLLLLFDKKTIDGSLILGLSNAWWYVFKGDINGMISMLPNLERQCLEAGLLEINKGHYLGEINVLKAYARYNFNIDMLVCLDHASTALELLTQDNLYAIGVAWVFYGGALQALGKSLVAKKDIMIRLDASSSPVVRSNLYLILCYIHWMDGNISELSAVSSTLINLGQSHHLKEAEANGYYFSGCANFAKNRRTEALRDFRNLYDLRHFTLMVHRFFGSAALAFLLPENDTDELADLLKEMRLNAMERGGIQYVGFVQAITAAVNWVKSKSPESLQWAMEAKHLPLLPMSNFTSNPMLQSFILSSSGHKDHVERALEILYDCEVFLKKHNNINFLTQTYVLRTLAQLKLGEQKAAFKDFQLALELAVPRGLYSTFLTLKYEVLSDFLQTSSLSSDAQKFLEEILRSLRFRRQNKKPILSRREKEIFELIRENLTNKQIGTKLYISEKTVKRHIANIYKKLDVHNRNQAIDKAELFSL